MCGLIDNCSSRPRTRSTQDKDFFDKYLSGLVGEVFGEELMDKTKPDFYMVNFLRDDVLDEEGSLVEEAPKVSTSGKRRWPAGAFGVPT